VRQFSPLSYADAENAADSGRGSPVCLLAIFRFLFGRSPVGCRLAKKFESLRVEWRCWALWRGRFPGRKRIGFNANSSSSGSARLVHDMYKARSTSISRGTRC
jgi:hypothetical protein